LSETTSCPQISVKGSGILSE